MLARQLEAVSRWEGPGRRVLLVEALGHHLRRRCRR